MATDLSCGVRSAVRIRCLRFMSTKVTLLLTWSIGDTDQGDWSLEGRAWCRPCATTVHRYLSIWALIWFVWSSAVEVSCSLTLHFSPLKINQKLSGMVLLPCSACHLDFCQTNSMHHGHPLTLVDAVQCIFGPLQQLWAMPNVIGCLLLSWIPVARFQLSMFPGEQVLTHRQFLPGVIFKAAATPATWHSSSLLQGKS